LAIMLALGATRWRLRRVVSLRTLLPVGFGASLGVWLSAAAGKAWGATVDVVGGVGVPALLLSAVLVCACACLGIIVPMRRLDRTASIDLLNARR
jgi:hypothetical protein